MVSALMPRGRGRHVGHHHICRTAQPILDLLICPLGQKIQHMDLRARNRFDLLQVNPQHGADRLVGLFAKRIDDYKELFQVQERTGGREPAEYYRYYSTQRPVDLGTFPKSPGNAPVEIINFDERRMVEGGTMRAWGELAYLKPLTEKQMEDYELRPAPGNPDRDKAHPSITAKLQAARRQEPPKEPGKAKHHKSHEDR